MTTGSLPRRQLFQATERVAGRQISVSCRTKGNLTAWNGETYQYDGFNQMKHMVNGSQEWLYMYDADDERFWSFQVGGPPARFDRFTLRDLSGKALRTYEATAYNWTGSVAEDDVYSSGPLLAAETTQGTRHFHLDHLGTPRLVTNAGGRKMASFRSLVATQPSPFWRFGSTKMARSRSSSISITHLPPTSWRVCWI